MYALHRERFQRPFDLPRVVAVALHRGAVVGLAGHEIVPHHAVTGVRDGLVLLSNVITGESTGRPADTLVTVTSRLPQDGLATELVQRSGEWEAAGLVEVVAIGDAHVPATIAAAVWDGRRFAEELDGRDPQATFRRNVAAL